MPQFKQLNESRNPFRPFSPEWWQFWEALYGSDMEGPLDEDLAYGTGPSRFNAECLLMITNYNLAHPDAPVMITRRSKAS